MDGMALRAGQDRVAQVRNLVRPIVSWLDGRPLERELGEELSRRFPPTGPEFSSLAESLRESLPTLALGQRVDETTVCAHIADPSEELCGFSCDAVLLTNARGGKHRHPKGEIDMVISLDDGATFDGHGNGWVVYPPGSAHRPTSRGSVIVLFLLPNGEMSFE